MHERAMEVRPWRLIERRQSRKIRVGSVEVGGDAPDLRAEHDQHADV